MKINQRNRSPFNCTWSVSTQGHDIVDSTDVGRTPWRKEVVDGSFVITNWEGRPARGLLEHIADQGPWLVEKYEKSPLEGKAVYDPQAVKNLHRKFAGIDPSAENLKKFADQFGLLGRGVRLNGGMAGQVCESLQYWRMHIGRMQTLLRIWDLCKKMLNATKQELLSAKDELDEYVGVNFGARIRPLAVEGREHLSLYPFPTFTEADLYVRQKTDLEAEVPKRSADFSLSHVGLLLLREEINYEISEGVRAVVNPSEFGSGVRLIPRDLLGAMYVQFAEETIGSSKPPIKCPGCGEWFAPVDARQKNCSGACKQKVWRMTQKEGKRSG